MNVPDKEFAAFINELTATSAQSTLRAHLDASWKGINRADEVSALRNYLTLRGVGIDYLNRNVAQVLSGRYEFKFASVFCHQKPRVRRVPSLRNPCTGSTKGCELGDLLVVFVFVDSRKQPMVVRAFLSQAKVRPEFDSKSQTCLYDWDEEFCMPRSVWGSSILNYAQRYLPSHGAGRSNALKYLVLRPDAATPVVFDPPAKSGMHQTWGVAVSRLVLGSEGHRFDETKIGVNHWDGVLHELFMIGAGKIKSSITRGTDSIVDLVNTFNHFNHYDHFSKTIEKHDGVSMMLVIVRDKDFAVG